MNNIIEIYKEYLKLTNSERAIIFEVIKDSFCEKRKLLEFILENIELSEEFKNILKRMSDYNLEKYLIKTIKILITLIKEENVLNKISNDFLNLYQPLDKNGQEYYQ